MDLIMIFMDGSEDILEKEETFPCDQDISTVYAKRLSGIQTLSARNDRAPSRRIIQKQSPSWAMIPLNEHDMNFHRCNYRLRLVQKREPDLSKIVTDCFTHSIARGRSRMSIRELLPSRSKASFSFRSILNSLDPPKRPISISTSNFFTLNQ